MQSKVVGFVTFVIAAAACGGAQHKPAPIEEKPITIDGGKQLSDAVRPLRYQLDLTIDPRKDTFSGTVVIDVEIAEATHALYLHADKMEVGAVRLTPTGGAAIDAQAVSGPEGGLAVVHQAGFPAGPASLELTFSAPLDDVAEGLYRVNVGEQWYAYTQFEPLDAREAFPSFDEPKFKTPFDVTIRAPKGMVAVANTLETGRADEGEWTTFTFAQSKPLPTYLVAFAVGDFDIVEAPADAIPNVPFRLLAPKGRGELGAFMLEKTPLLLAELVDYFGSPYPFDKLDVIAVPNFTAGAMENVGLVTFRDTLLLLDPATSALSQRRAAMSVMTHELAHMWFGNLVTMPWWDDLWLNEAFATWMAHRVMVKVMPEMEQDIEAARSVTWIVDTDSKPQTRAIRQPIVTPGDVYNAFDGITYGKGAAVLRMFEAWAGPEVFRDGVRAYLEDNKWGNGTTAELFSALTASTKKEIGPAMKNFLDQPGAPLLSMELVCGNGVPKLKVSQTRYLPARSEAPQGEPWSVPFCVKLPDGNGEKVHCDLLDVPKKQFDLPLSKCPEWVYPNANQAGYYRWELSDEMRAKLVSKATLKKLGTADKVDILSNLSSAFESEKLSAKDYYAIIDSFGREKHRVVVDQVSSSLYALRRFAPEEQQPAVAKKVQKLLGDDMRRLGYSPGKHEAVEDTLARPNLMQDLAFLGGDEKVRKEARRVTDAFLKDMGSQPLDLVRMALKVAAWDGDAALWLSYQMALSSAPNPAARGAIISGLGSFGDPELQKRSLGLFLDGTLLAQDMWSLIGPSFREDATFRVTWAWFAENFDAIVGQVGEFAIPRMPGVASRFCDEAGLAEMTKFFSDPAHRRDGTERNLANTQERIRECMAMRAFIEKDLEAILK